MSEANSTGVSTSLTSGESKTSSTIKIDELLSACLFLAKESGVVIRAIYERGANKNFTDKRVTSGSESVEEDPQTEADLHSQRIIIGSLKTLYPNLTIIGEEGKVDWNPEDVVKPDLSLCAEIKTLPADKLVVPVEDLCVWVDPLDGTKEFVYGTTDTVTTLIGIAVKGAAHAGVVYKPFVDKAMWGAVGAGVFGDYKVKNFADTNPEFPRTICTSSSHSTPALVANIESLHVDKIVRIGGAGAKGLHVLTAGADAYVYPQNGTKKWDTCAIHALFEAVGGRLTDAFGDPISYFPTEPYANRNGIVASLSANHDSYLLKKGTKLS